MHSSNATKARIAFTKRPDPHSGSHALLPFFSSRPVSTTIDSRGSGLTGLATSLRGTLTYASCGITGRLPFRPYVPRLHITVFNYSSLDTLDTDHTQALIMLATNGVFLAVQTVGQSERDRPISGDRTVGQILGYVSTVFAVGNVVVCMILARPYQPYERKYKGVSNSLQLDALATFSYADPHPSPMYSYSSIPWRNGCSETAHQPSKG